MKAVISFLLEPRVSFWKYCFLAYTIALLPTVAILSAALGVLVAFGADPDLLEQPSAMTLTTGGFVLAVVIFPVLETLLLAVTIWVVFRLVRQQAFAAAVAALLWGALHATVAPFWFFGTVWSFFVFSCAFMAWRRNSFKQAVGAAAIPHCLINLTAFASQGF
jgi:hypothetical protein